MGLRARMVKIGVLISAVAGLTNANAMGRPQIIEIDGQKLTIRESMDLIFHRANQSAIAEFKSVKLNGEEMTPFVIQSGISILLHADNGSGDSMSVEEKLKSSNKTAILCNQEAVGIPPGITIDKVISLSSGQGAFARTVDQQFQINGNWITFFICR